MPYPRKFLFEISNIRKIYGLGEKTLRDLMFGGIRASLLTASSNYTSNNLPRTQNQRPLVQF
jgi:hypothetical protein